MAQKKGALYYQLVDSGSFGSEEMAPDELVVYQCIKNTSDKGFPSFYLRNLDKGPQEQNRNPSNSSEQVHQKPGGQKDNQVG